MKRLNEGEMLALVNKKITYSTTIGSKTKVGIYRRV